MSRQAHTEYLLARAIAERRMGQSATDARAAAAHAELAARYEALAAEQAADRPEHSEASG